MKFIDLLVTLISFLKKSSKRKTIQYCMKLYNKTGLEIGGPSNLFSLKSFLPAYVFSKKIDGVNYSTETIWEGLIKEGNNYNYYRNKNGYQFITEATNLSMIADGCYDFLLSSHSLEHVANPLKALKEWNRVLKNKGIIILVLPDKQYTFDNNRPYTKFSHLLNDYDTDINEYDTTHFEEVISLHNITRDKIGTLQKLIERTNNNYTNRCLHHHVFSFEVITEMLNYCSFKKLYQATVKPFHSVTIARKVV